MGDCEDSSFLLTSMLRRIEPNMEAYSTVGYFDQYGHVWTSILRNGEWLVLDTTLDRMPQLVPTERSRPMYRPLFRFNERDIIIVDPNFADLPILHERGKDAVIQTWYAVLQEITGNANLVWRRKEAWRQGAMVEGLAVEGGPYLQGY